LDGLQEVLHTEEDKEMQDLAREELQQVQKEVRHTVLCCAGGGGQSGGTCQDRGGEGWNMQVKARTKLE
jgi:hypothetical protein